MTLFNRFKTNILEWIASKTLNYPFYQSFRRLQENVKDASQFEKEILNNFFQLVNKNVDDIMIPRSDICAVPIDTSMENLTKIVGSHTRTLVYRDTLDDIVGFVHIKDLYFNLSESKKLNLRSILRKPIMVVHSMKLIDLLKYMQQQRTHIACVVDEYGGTDGIVTIEDVISELIGPMNDEHETQNANQINYEIINKDTIIVNARMEIEDLEKLLNITLKSANDDFDTIGGMVLAKAGKMPNIKDIIEINDKLKAEIILKDLRTIKTIKLTISE